MLVTAIEIALHRLAGFVPYRPRELGQSPHLARAICTRAERAPLESECPTFPAYGATLNPARNRSFADGQTGPIRGRIGVSILTGRCTWLS
jgi:hypothetical protein